MYNFFISYLFVFFHSGIEFLRKVIGDVGHPWLLFIGSAQAALVLTRLLVVLLLCIFTITFCVLHKKEGEISVITGLTGSCVYL